MVNLNKVSNFLKKDSDYIIVVDRSGNIWDAKRSSIFTFLGRAFGWLTGHSYDLKKVAEAVKNNPAFQNQDNEQMNEFIKKLNKKIRSYNLKHSENGARKIPSLSESLNCNRKKSSGSTSLGALDLGLSMKNLNNFDARQAEPRAVIPAGTLETEVLAIKKEVSKAFSEASLPNQTLPEEKSTQNPTNDVLIIHSESNACKSARIAEPRDRYTVRVTENVEFCLSIDNGLIYPIFPENKTEAFQVLHFADPAEWVERGMFSLILYNPKIPYFFIRLAISVREKILFIDQRPILIVNGNDAKEVALTGKEESLKRIYSTNFSKMLNLSDEEKKLLIEACKFLTYASRVTKNPERFELSLESLSKIIKLIDKIGLIIARVNQKKINEGVTSFNRFSKIMKQVAHDTNEWLLERA